MIHLGNAKTKRTACGKPLKRRWWVPRSHRITGRIGGLGVYLVVDTRKEITCPECKKHHR